MSDTELREALAGLITWEQAAALAGVSSESVRKWAKAGHIRTVKLGWAARIVRSSLMEHLERRAAHQLVLA